MKKFYTRLNLLNFILDVESNSTQCMCLNILFVISFLFLTLSDLVRRPRWVRSLLLYHTAPCFHIHYNLTVGQMEIKQFEEILTDFGTNFVPSSFHLKFLTLG